MKSLLFQLIRFGLVGVLATATQVLIGWLLVRGFGVAVVPANAAGFVAALTLSYFGQRNWTFRYRDAHLPAMSRFVTVSLAGFALSNLIIWYVVLRSAWPFEIALSLIVLTVPPFTWIMSRVWTFKPSTRS